MDTSLEMQTVHQNHVMIRYLLQMILIVKIIYQDVNIYQMEIVINNLEYALDILYLWLIQTIIKKRTGVLLEELLQVHNNCIALTTQVLVQPLVIHH